MLPKSDLSPKTRVPPVRLSLVIKVQNFEADKELDKKPYNVIFGRNEQYYASCFTYIMFYPNSEYSPDMLRFHTCSQKLYIHRLWMSNSTTASH